MKGTLYGVGVGPGDPELLTLKAVRIITRSPVIAVPAEKKEAAAAYEIAAGAVGELSQKPCLTLPVPMTGDQEQTAEAYRRAAEAIAAVLDRGQDVAYLTLGDPCLYSTCMYICRLVQEQGYQVLLVSGVPSVCAAAAAAGESLADHQEPVHILPSEEGLAEALQLPGKKILMKGASRSLRLKQLLEGQAVSLTMVERCGMKEERIIRSVRELPDRRPYFSLGIIKDKEQKETAEEGLPRGAYEKCLGTERMEDMEGAFSRTERMLGEEGMKRLAGARVAVFGIGGVGGHAMEALVRSGIGAIDLIDNDTVSLSNLNRQIIATRQTIGQYKVDAARERIRSICPECSVTTHRVFLSEETIGDFDFSQYDYIVDAIDTVAGKLALAVQARACGVPLISSMGAGNKMDPSRLEVADISKTSVCPLARVMRRELRNRGISHLKVVYSKEPAIKPAERSAAGCSRDGEDSGEPEAFVYRKRQTPGSNAFVPAAAGLLIAAEVVKDLSGWTPSV